MPEVLVDDSNAAAHEQLVTFVARARREHARAARQRALVGVGLPVLVGGALVAFAWPSWLPWLPLPAALVVGLGLLLADRRGRRTADRRLLEGLRGDQRHVELVGDELATWLEQRRRGELAQPMAQWLASDLASGLATLPPAAVQRLGRRPFGRIRYLLPVAVVAWLAWLLLHLALPPLPGLLGGAPRADRSGETPGAGDGQRQPTPAEGGGTGTASPSPLPPPPEPEPEPEPEPPPPQPPGPPPPLLQLPFASEVVVPQFVDDGPTRKQMAQRALLPEDGPGGNAPPPAATGSGGTAAAPPTPRTAFARAAERALQSRHVPAAEQPMVRRYFELLQQEAK